MICTVFSFTEDELRTPELVGLAAVCVSLTVTWTVFSDAEEAEAEGLLKLKEPVEEEEVVVVVVVGELKLKEPVEAEGARERSGFEVWEVAAEGF